jgi:hypothetical protein
MGCIVSHVEYLPSRDAMPDMDPFADDHEESCDGCNDVQASASYGFTEAARPSDSEETALMPKRRDGRHDSVVQEVEGHRREDKMRYVNPERRKKLERRVRFAEGS